MSKNLDIKKCFKGGWASRQPTNVIILGNWLYFPFACYKAFHSWKFETLNALRWWWSGFRAKHFDYQPYRFVIGHGVTIRGMEQAIQDGMEVANIDMVKREKESVRDAEYEALSYARRRSTPITSEELDWRIKNDA